MIFFTLNLTENDNCKRYDEYEYDRKQLLCTVNVYSTVYYENKVDACLQYCLL